MTASHAPSPSPSLPNSEHSPVCLPKYKCQMVAEVRVADSHFMGVVLITEVMNELRKHKQIMQNIHPCTLSFA